MSKESNILLYSKFKYFFLVVIITIVCLTEVNSQKKTKHNNSYDKLINERFFERFHDKLILENRSLESIDKNYLMRVSGLSPYDRKYISGTDDPRYFFSKLTLDSMKLPRMSKELKCLSEAIYFESRGEQLEGQIAVADVIINRKNSRYFPNTICRVVSEGSHKRHACQFSYNCDGKLETISDKKAYRRVVKLSAMLLRGAFGDITDGSTFFHASEVNPSWAKKFKKTKKIGRHIFYKR